MRARIFVSASGHREGSGENTLRSAVACAYIRCDCCLFGRLGAVYVSDALPLALSLAPNMEARPEPLWCTEKKGARVHCGTK